MKKASLLVAVALVAGSVSAALMTGGYAVGSDQLSPDAEILFADSAALGGFVDLNDSDGFAPWFTVKIPGSGYWDIGDSVEITGIAVALRGGTANGTMTFDIREAVGGTGTSGSGGLNSLGTATATFNGSGTTSTYYVNFDAPVTFVADANSTSIGINIRNSGTIQLKADASFPYERYNYDNGALQSSGMKVSVAGNVIPEPASLGLIAVVGGALLFIRRRFMI